MVLPHTLDLVRRVWNVTLRIRESCVPVRIILESSTLGSLLPDERRLTCVLDWASHPNDSLVPGRQLTVALSIWTFESFVNELLLLLIVLLEMILFDIHDLVGPDLLVVDSSLMLRHEVTESLLLLSVILLMVQLMRVLVSDFCSFGPLLLLFESQHLLLFSVIISYGLLLSLLLLSF